jgi:probable phosphoglycerate mutase
MLQTTLLIARHGNTFNADDVPLRVGARTDLPLVESGLKQGFVLGQHLKEKNLIPQIIFTSTMLRTIQTAEQIKKGLGMENIPTEALEIFNEIDYGPDEGKPEDEVIARIGETAIKDWEEQSLVPQGWLVDTTGLRAAWFDFGERVAKEFSGQTIMIVTHNGIARFSTILTGDSHGLDGDGKVNLKLKTGGYGHLVHTDPFWKCIEWNVRPSVKTGE